MPDYANEGTTTFEAAGWNDGAGGSGTGFANDAELIVDKRIGVVNAGLDQSALGTGINYLDITSGCTGGQIGAAGTPLIFDADTASTDFFRCMGDCTVYLEAGGGNTLINNVHVGRGKVVLTGGSFANVTVSGGTLIVEEAVDITTTLTVDGGSVELKYNANDVPTLRQQGGYIDIKRPYTTAHVGGGTFADNRETGAGTTMNQYGGTYVALRGDVANYNGYGGVLDGTQALEAVTIGSSSGLSLGALTIRRGDKVDVTALARPNAYQTSGGLGI